MYRHGRRTIEARELRNLVFQGGDRKRALPAIRLGYVLSPGRQCPIRSPLNTRVQILEVCLHVCRVVLPCHPVYAEGCCQAPT